MKWKRLEKIKNLKHYINIKRKYFNRIRLSLYNQISSTGISLNKTSPHQALYTYICFWTVHIKFLRHLMETDLTIGSLSLRQLIYVMEIQIYQVFIRLFFFKYLEMSDVVEYPLKIMPVEKLQTWLEFPWVISSANSCVPPKRLWGSLVRCKEIVSYGCCFY